MVRRCRFNRCSQWLAARGVHGLGGGLELLERVSHALEEFAVPVGRDVEDPSPDRDLLDLVGLGDLRTAGDGLEAITPHGGLAAALLGGEGEFAVRCRRSARGRHETSA